MRVILAPDSFKGSLTAAEAAEAMVAGIRRVDESIAVDRCPISDGGEGFVASMAAAAGGALHTTAVAGPLGGSVDAQWATLPDGSAVIEMAGASGLVLVPKDQLDPAQTTTSGTGQLVAAALRQGCRRVMLGLGGSATTDGGAGMAQALGVRFFDKQNQLIEAPMTGGRLASVSRIDTAEVLPEIREAEFVVACDVTNPLTGPSGAAAIYGPQKGATPEQVRALDGNLKHLAALLRDQHGIDIEHVPGAGAAGGLGAGLVAFCNAKLRSGIEMVLDATRFAERVADCDLCLTGEGRLDGQSLSGKAILGVAKTAGTHNVPTIALVGSADDDAEVTLSHGLRAYHVIAEGHPLDYAMQYAAELLANKTETVMRAWT